MANKSYNLAPREIELQKLLDMGWSNQAAANLMGIKVTSVEAYIKKIKWKKWMKSGCISTEPLNPPVAAAPAPVKPVLPEKIVNGVLPQSQAPKQFLTIDVAAIPEGAYLVSTDQGPVIRFFKDGRWYFPTNCLTIDLTREASSSVLICILRKVS